MSRDENLKEFDKVVKCLALTISSDSIYDDVLSRYNRLRRSIMQCNPEIVERK